MEGHGKSVLWPEGKGLAIYIVHTEGRIKRAIKRQSSSLRTCHAPLSLDNFQTAPYTGSRQSKRWYWKVYYTVLCRVQVGRSAPPSLALSSNMGSVQLTTAPSHPAIQCHTVHGSPDGSLLQTLPASQRENQRKISVQVASMAFQGSSRLLTWFFTLPHQPRQAGASFWLLRCISPPRIPVYTTTATHSQTGIRPGRRA